MENSKVINKFYLDKEKDIIVNLYKTNEDELTYILETPNHGTGNLITNLAKICNLETIKNEKDMKIIKATIPAISKTLMSQTKNYNLDINQTLVKSYILKKAKFRTDLHTHMNANLSADCLIALGIKHQVRYPLYYIKKLDLKITKKQEEKIYEQRKEVEKQFENSELQGKYLIRRIDDNTFINFADLILNNLENADENILKIRKSLEILKDGQAVFTNLEKLYLYRYVFARGIESEEKIELENNKIKQIPDKEIKEILNKMIEDSKEDSPYAKINLRQDKLLWVARWQT